MNLQLVERAATDFLTVWAAIRKADPTDARDVLLRAFPDLVQTYGITAAVLGADWYDETRDAPVSASSYRAAIADPPSVEQVQGAVRWGVGPMFEGDADGTQSRLAGSLQRLVLQAGRDSTINAARRDPVRHGFARMPSGPTTCRFCTMLASRGFVYSSAASAGESAEFHDDCDCIIVAGRDAKTLPYDIATYVNAYRHDSGIGRDPARQD